MKTSTAFVVILISGALGIPVNKTLDAKDIISTLPSNTTLSLLTARVHATNGTHTNYTEIATDMAARDMDHHREEMPRVFTRGTDKITNTTVSQLAARAMNINTTTSGVVARVSNITTSDYDTRGLSKKQLEYYRTLAMAEAHEQFKRNTNVSASSLVATNST